MWWAKTRICVGWWSKEGMDDGPKTYIMAFFQQLIHRELTISLDFPYWWRRIKVGSLSMDNCYRGLPLK